jgi:hypothetical protein
MKTKIPEYTRHVEKHILKNKNKISSFFDKKKLFNLSEANKIKYLAWCVD